MSIRNRLLYKFVQSRILSGTPFSESNPLANHRSIFILLLVSFGFIALFGCDSADPSPPATVFIPKVATAVAEVEATSEASQLNQANRVTIIVTNKTVVNDRSHVSGEPCDKAGLPGGVNCGGVTWRDSFGKLTAKHVSLDSQCWTDVAVGYDLPESCRR